MRSSSSKAFNILAQILSERPAQVMGIDKVKGSIAVGKHADFVIWDPNDVAETDNLHYLYPDLSLVKGRVMFGRIRRTYLRGNLVYADGHVLGPHGQLLTNN